MATPMPKTSLGPIGHLQNNHDCPFTTLGTPDNERALICRRHELQQHNKAVLLAAYTRHFPPTERWTSVPVSKWNKDEIAGSIAEHELELARQDTLLAALSPGDPVQLNGYFNGVFTVLEVRPERRAIKLDSPDLPEWINPVCVFPADGPLQVAA